MFLAPMSSSPVFLFGISVYYRGVYKPFDWSVSPGKPESLSLIYYYIQYFEQSQLFVIESSSPDWPGTFYIDKVDLELLISCHYLPSAGIMGMCLFILAKKIKSDLIKRLD